MNLLRRKFLQLAGAGAAFGAVRGHGWGDAPPPGMQLAELKRAAAKARAQQWINDRLNPVEEFKPSNPVRDMLKDIARAKATPAWLFDPHAETLNIREPDYSHMRSWKPWFQQLVAQSEWPKLRKRNHIRFLKRQLKELLWQRGGGLFP